MTTFVFFLILLHVSYHASGAVVEVEEGESADLPCTASSVLSENAVVEWHRNAPFLTVHIRRNNRDQPSDQDALYRRRTAMRMNAQESRDLTLTLSDVTIFDKGVYVCSVTDGKNQYKTEVELRVNLKKDDIVQLLNEVRGAVIGVGVCSGIGFIVIGIILFKKHIKG